MLYILQFNFVFKLTYFQLKKVINFEYLGCKSIKLALLACPFSKGSLLLDRVSIIVI